TKLRYADRLGQPYWALFTKVPSSKSQKIAVLIINIRTLVESFEIPWIHSIRILYNNSSIYESPPKPSNQVGAIETIISWGEEDFLMLTSASEIYLSSQTSSLGIVFLITALVLSTVGTALFYTIIQSRLLNKTLNESNHRFMAIYLHVGAPIIILNNESIHDVNPAALNVLGGNLDEFKGKSIFSFLLIDQNLTDEKIFNYRQKLRYESFVRFECKIKRRDGRILDVELTITKGKSTSMTHSYVLINDLTEKKKQDEVFAREHDIMIDNTRLKSLATMAGGIAHEINNPLAIISGIAQQLHRKIQLKIPLTQVDQDACSKITRNTERISNIIGKLQSLTPQAQQLQFLDFSVDEFLNDMNLIYSKKC
ncbi:MAG TPA: PAS domain S-box protein, partial [Pseudobdellovibrionaceae bacterium]|nr:PAS domain S-box protein [Pseudobdellovibrionaceae bacterium]